MRPAVPSRRLFLSTSVLAMGAAFSPFRVDAVEIAAPEWLQTLEKSLRRHGGAVSKKWTGPSRIEYHCTLTDPVRFGMAEGNLGGLRVKVKASGNRLSLQHGGLTAELVLAAGFGSALSTLHPAV